MTVTKKMILLVLSALLGIVGLSATSIYQTGRVFESANYGNVNTVPSLTVINKAMHTFAQQRLRIHRHLLVRDAAQMAEVEAGLLKARSELDEALKQYELLVSDDRDRQFLAQERALFAEYKAANDEILALSRQNKSAEATLSLNKHADIASKLNQTFEEHIAYNEQLGKKGAEERNRQRSDEGQQGGAGGNRGGQQQAEQDKQRGGSGNFANDPQRASEAGRKGGQS